MIVLSSGLNRMRGTFGPSSVPEMHDLDYATIDVPEGTVPDAFGVVAADSGRAFSFLGIEAGPVVTIPRDWTSMKSPLLGRAHFGSASVGFSGPLPAGTCTLWIMELDMGSVYSWDFGLAVTAIPSPGPVDGTSAARPAPARPARPESAILVPMRGLSIACSLALATALAACGKPFAVESDPPGAEVALYFENEMTRDLRRVWWFAPRTPVEVQPGIDCRSDVCALRVLWPDGTLSEMRRIEPGVATYRFEKAKAPPSETTRGH